MPPDVNYNEPEPRPERVFPRMPRLMDPPSPPRQQPARDRNGNRNRNQPAAQNNNQEGNGNADEQRRIPFLFRFFIGPHIARYMRMRRAMREGRRQNAVAPAVPANIEDENAGAGPSEQRPSGPGPSQPGPSGQGSSGQDSSGQGPSSSRGN